MMKAKDIMTKDVLTVSLDTPVKKVAELLADYEISGAPVLDEHDRVIGVVTESDLIEQKKNLHLPTVVTLFEGVLFLERPQKMKREIEKMLGATVKDIYSKKVITINEDATLEDIATIMSEKKVHLLPVLRGDDLVGVVGKVDVVRALAKE
ncbi:MAG: CBS domain-containing protein [Nitrospinae bacterium]|nr:CBS domain-containing protein [Nitrospinota bacterium]